MKFNDETYRKLMRKYKDTYYALLNEDGVYVLANQVGYNRIRKGIRTPNSANAKSAEVNIEAYNTDGSTLMLYMVNGSTRYMNSIINQLGGSDGEIVFNANVDTEGGYFHFDAKHIDKVCETSGIKKRPVFTEETLKAKRESAKRLLAV
ncbi:hypothetical protein AB4345_05315 [Vibrio breoganii]